MPTGTLAPIGRQFFDNAGAVLAGGSVLSQLGGTTTSAPTYSDIDLAVGHLNANPCVLDASGRAKLFIPRGTSYRFTIKDSAGVTIEVVDQILVYDDPTPAAAVVEWPIGMWGEWGGSAAPGANWSLCIGTTYKKLDYPTCYGVIGDFFAKGTEASDEFSIPDKRQRYSMGQAPTAVSTPVDPTLATNQSGTDLAAGNYKVAIVGVSATGAVSLPSASITQAVGAGGAGRIVVTYTLPTGASKVRVYVTTLAGATCDRYFEATASPYNFNTLTGAVVGALPTAATVTGATLGATFGAIDHVHLGPAHTHGMTGATASDGTEAVTGATASDTANVTASSSAGVDGAGSNFLYGSLTDSGHTHAAGTLAGPAHMHAVGTLATAVEGVRESAAGNPPSLVCNYAIRMK